MNEQLKPFQQVLVRDRERGTWMCDLFSHYDRDLEIHFCVGGRYESCIPYEGNEALLGTTGAPKKIFRYNVGDRVYCHTDGNMHTIKKCVNDTDNSPYYEMEDTSYKFYLDEVIISTKEIFNFMQGEQ